MWCPARSGPLSRVLRGGTRGTVFSIRLRKSSVQGAGLSLLSPKSVQGAAPSKGSMNFSWLTGQLTQLHISKFFWTYLVDGHPTEASLLGLWFKETESLVPDRNFYNFFWQEKLTYTHTHAFEYQHNTRSNENSRHEDTMW